MDFDPAEFESFKASSAPASGGFDPKEFESFKSGKKDAKPSGPDEEPADHGLSERQKLSPVEKALSPITSYPETYQRMNKDARDLVSIGVSQIANHDSLTDPQAHGASDIIAGAVKAAAGTLGYVASPITAAYRSIAGQPVEDVTGIPREYTEFAAQLATPGIGLTGKPTAPSIAGKPLQPGQEVTAAADRLSQSGGKVQVPVAVATDNMALQQTGAASANVPIAGLPLVKSAERTLDQLGTKSDEVAQGFGGAAPVAQAGETAKSSIKDWITGESAATSKKFYDKVDEAVDPAVTTELASTRKAAQSILDRRSNAAISESSGAVKRIEEAVTRPDGMNYEGIKDLRSYIRELKENPSVLPTDISGKELNTIYDALSLDLKAAVRNAGGEKASVAFDRANRHYSLLSDRREALAKVIGADGNAPAESVFNKLTAMAGSTSRADTAKLVQARKAMGSDDWNELASTVAGRLGRDVEGNFSPQRFVTDWGKISDEGKRVLFRSSEKAGLADHLDDIATVSSRFKELQKFANPSGSARTGIAGVIGMGAYADPLTTAKVLLGSGAVSFALSRPASAASVAKLAKSQLAVVESPNLQHLTAYMVAAKNLINALDVRGVTSRDFLRSLQGPMPAGAKDEKH